MNRAIRTELLKQRTTRTFVIAIAAAAAVAALITVAILGAAGKQDNDPLGPASLVQAIGGPADVLTVIALMLGILGMTGEYRHQTITTTFLATPRRRDVIVAKLIAHSLTGAAIGTLSLAISLAITLPWLHSSNVTIHADTHTLRVATGLIVSTGLYSALGVSIGALIRNQTAAAAAVLVWLLAIEGVISDIFARYAFISWLPVAAGRTLVHPSDGLAFPAAAALFTAYVAAFAAAGARFTQQRDIT